MTSLQKRINEANPDTVKTVCSLMKTHCQNAEVVAQITGLSKGMVKGIYGANRMRD